MDDTWLIIHLHGDVHLWNFGDLADADREATIMAARASVDFPADDQWAVQPELMWQKVAAGVPDRQVLATSVMVSFGDQPHDDLMARATVHSRGELAELSVEKVDGYRAQYVENVRRHQVETLAASLSGVDPAVLAEALAHPSLTVKP